MTKIRLALPYVFLFLLTALVLDLANPFFDKPARDGGFFLYAGDQIVDGKIPYQDFWDSKRSRHFLYQCTGVVTGRRFALGRVVGGVHLSFWHISGFCTTHFSKRWGMGAALFGVTLAGLGLKTVLGYGNYTEEYALLFNAAGLALFLSMVDVERNYWKYIWVGALFGLSFTFRANNIGGLFAIMGAILLYYGFKRHYAEVLRILLATLAGFALPLILWTLYFAILGDAWEMIYASMTFNFSYSAAKDREWLDLFGGFGKYGMGWVGWFTNCVVRAWASFSWSIL